MTLIKSISGIRGTIGNTPGDNLTPVDSVKFVSAYAKWLKNYSDGRMRVVVGRDARPSGEMLYHCVCGALLASGIDVIDLGLATTPTVEMAVEGLGAQGGIILTASHNPVEWNALKLLEGSGRIVNQAQGTEILRLAEAGDFDYVEVEKLGSIEKADYLDAHIRAILDLELVDHQAIAQANFTVAVDAVNSVGGIAIPRLLRALGVVNIVEINCIPDGRFAHNPEPLPQHLTEIAETVKTSGAHLGLVVDPDVDRLAIVCEDGSMFGEEYTLVAVADYVLTHQPGGTVSNLSSSRALKDVTERRGHTCRSAAVGEVNVVNEMIRTQAVIGGEGNGGVIYPPLHYGRDALVGTALFLTSLAKSRKSCSSLRNNLPAYFMSKNKIELKPGIDLIRILDAISLKYSNLNVSTIDGVRIDFETEKEWVHLRQSNTEPIIRIYTEATDAGRADKLAQKFIGEINALI